MSGTKTDLFAYAHWVGMPDPAFIKGTDMCESPPF